MQPAAVQNVECRPRALHGQKACTAGILLALFITTHARSATYSTPIKGLTVDSSGAFSDATFDFGFSFSHIDTVSLELRLSEDLPEFACARGFSCRLSSMHIAIYDPNLPVDLNDFSVLVGASSNPDALRAGFGFMRAGQPTELGFIPPNSGLDPTTFEFYFGMWQDFLFAGRGAARIRQLELSSGSDLQTHAPSNIDSLRLIIEGVAVPEPSAAVLGCMAAICAAGFARRFSRKILVAAR